MRSSSGTERHPINVFMSELTMNGKYVPEDTYLQLYSEFRKLKEKTMQECKVVRVFWHIFSIHGQLTHEYIDRMSFSS